MITWLLLILTVLAAIGFYWYDKNGAKFSKEYGKKEESFTEKNSKKAELIETIGIEDITDSVLGLGGVIQLKNGGMRALLSVSTSDFELLTEEEQDSFENTLMQFGLSLTFPIQFFTTTIKVSTKETTKNIETVIKDESDEITYELKDYAKRLKERLEEIETERGMFVRKSYCVVSIDGQQDERRSVSELTNRIHSVKENLEQAKGIKVNILKAEEIAQVLASQFNKGSSMSVKGLIEAGALELFTLGREMEDEKTDSRERKSVEFEEEDEEEENNELI